MSNCLSVDLPNSFCPFPCPRRRRRKSRSSGKSNHIPPPLPSSSLPNPSIIGSSISDNLMQSLVRRGVEWGQEGRHWGRGPLSAPPILLHPPDGGWQGGGVVWCGVVCWAPQCKLCRLNNCYLRIDGRDWPSAVDAFGGRPGGRPDGWQLPSDDDDHVSVSRSTSMSCMSMSPAITTAMFIYLSLGRLIVKIYTKIYRKYLILQTHNSPAIVRLPLLIHLSAPDPALPALQQFCTCPSFVAQVGQKRGILARFRHRSIAQTQPGFWLQVFGGKLWKTLVAIGWWTKPLTRIPRP